MRRCLRLQPEQAAQRCLDAVPVEKLALDLGGLERLVADQVDGQCAFVVVADM